MNTYIKSITCCVFLVTGLSAFSQSGYHADSGIAVKDNSRKWLIGAVNVAGYGGSLIIFNNTWYKNFPKSSFHTFNDNKEWQQVDKAGHAWAAYNTGKASAAMWKWAGLSNKKATLAGGLSGAAYLTVIEILDAHSQKWGWSWADIGANIFGSGLFISQQLAWEEQRIQFKFSFHRHYYPDAATAQRANELFGENWTERMLKDYNSQTYWLSFNLSSLLKNKKWPAWFNVALGYGADGMLGGFENKWQDLSGNDITRYDIQRKRQFYLAPDIDFSKIKINKKGWRVLFDFLNILKFPSPALMMDNKGKFKAYAFYF